MDRNCGLALSRIFESQQRTDSAWPLGTSQGLDALHSDLLLVLLHFALPILQYQRVLPSQNQTLLPESHKTPSLPWIMLAFWHIGPSLLIEASVP